MLPQLSALLGEWNTRAFGRSRISSRVFEPVHGLHFPDRLGFRKAGNFWQRETGISRKWAAREFCIVPGVNWVLTKLLTLEARWLARGHRLGLGTSFVVIATKS